MEGSISACSGCIPRKEPALMLESLAGFFAHFARLAGRCQEKFSCFPQNFQIVMCEQNYPALSLGL
jgi:hypothetical protein